MQLPRSQLQVVMHLHRNNPSSRIARLLRAEDIENIEILKQDFLQPLFYGAKSRSRG
jgi:hypothetical protein